MFQYTKRKLAREVPSVLQLIKLMVRQQSITLTKVLHLPAEPILLLKSHIRLYREPLKKEFHFWVQEIAPWKNLKVQIIIVLWIVEWEIERFHMWKAIEMRGKIVFWIWFLLDLQKLQNLRINRQNKRWIQNKRKFGILTSPKVWSLLILSSLSCLQDYNLFPRAQPNLHIHQFQLQLLD